MICAAVGLPCAEPTIADVQAAYEQASRTPESRHLPGLQVLGIDCARVASAFTCQIVFKIAGEDGEREYVDAVAMRPDIRDGWQLVSGLCLSKR